MKYTQPSATLVTLMSEDVITASFNAVDIQQSTYSADKDILKYRDFLN